MPRSDRVFHVERLDKTGDENRHTYYSSMTLIVKDHDDIRIPYWKLREHDFSSAPYRNDKVIIRKGLLMRSPKTYDKKKLLHS